MSSSLPSQAAAAAAAYGCFHRFLLASRTLPSRSGGAGRARSLTLTLRSLPLVGHRPRSRRVACQAMTETDPEGNGDDEEKEEFRNDASSPSVDSAAEQNGSAESDSNIDNKDETSNAELLGSSDTQNIDGDATATNDTQENVEVVEVASGSPLPGMRQQLDDSVRIPKATIDILKDQVFGFDTFFVTSQEPYEGGVLFKGNLRGKPAKSFEKITNRLQNKFGDEYKLFLLVNPEDEKPVAVVIPRQTLQPETTAVPEWFAAAAFGLVTIFTLLLRNVPVLQNNLLSTFDNLELLKDGLSGALVTGLIIGVHEIGHILAARDSGIKLGVPYFVPSWQIGSFGAITRIVNIVRNREDLLKLAAAGPLAGFSLGFVLLLLGFILPPSDGLGLVIDPTVFHESFLVGGLAKLLLGDALKEGTQLSINPLVLWAWAGLLINAINSIPAGQLDGGRVAFAMWGRKISARLSSVTIGLLGISALFSDVAFYWVVLIFFLQRGPIAPLSEEITDPENNYISIGVTILLLGLLVCLPYPFPFDPSQLTNLDFDL
ncbi:probable zinc metalloprotease EGY2, chloroplastic isoform X2 [Phragmites australis]|uniref:probable zinc metalloprotease EGY2, chloroplastic isoform X2 n=1 Tax=Phragmites australis TaxID=29695 RepID=UPI002D7795E1|nr:probable zinc metalloprotease EGY2, chloroplastic isoform X2 [Phragmites australis]